MDIMYQERYLFRIETNLLLNENCSHSLDRPSVGCDHGGGSRTTRRKGRPYDRTPGPGAAVSACAKMRQI